jgi:hypothetical protein
MFNRSFEVVQQTFLRHPVVASTTPLAVSHDFQCCASLLAADIVLAESLGHSPHAEAVGTDTLFVCCVVCSILLASLLRPRSDL